jgi:hypothetical protein
MPVDEVVEVARWAFANQMGTLMLQSGELHGEKRLQYLEALARRVSGRAGLGCRLLTLPGLVPPPRRAPAAGYLPAASGPS